MNHVICNKFTGNLYSRATKNLPTSHLTSFLVIYFYLQLTEVSWLHFLLKFLLHHTMYGRGKTPAQSFSLKHF